MEIDWPILVSCPPSLGWHPCTMRHTYHSKEIKDPSFGLHLGKIFNLTLKLNNWGINCTFKAIHVIWRPGTCTIKHCWFVMYGFYRKLVCLLLTIEKTIAYYKICPFAFKLRIREIHFIVLHYDRLKRLTWNKQSSLLVSHIHNTSFFLNLCLVQ